MSVYSYWAYGLRIDAEIMCPELPPASPNMGEADVVIHLLPGLSKILETQDNLSYEVLPGLFNLVVKDVGKYRVEEGKHIFIEPFADASEDKIRLFLLGSTMGALLYQRGLFPLHGSAIETPWGAMIFVGAQGAGKSTLGAEFHSRGYRLLSDDVCAVSATSEGLQILPALAQFRLCSDAYERLGSPNNARFDVDKFVVPMGKGYCPHPVPLRAIHILGDHEQAEPLYGVLRGFDRVQRLLENLYRPHYLKGQKTQSDQLRLAGQIAQQAEMVSVLRRRDTGAIGSLVQFLESTWAARFAKMAVEEKN